MPSFAVHVDIQAWRAHARAPVERIRKAFEIGLEATATGAKTDMRQAVAAVLGEKLPGAIGSDVDPDRNTGWPGSAVIFSRGRGQKIPADRILEAFSLGATIRAVNGGRYLCVPTKFTPPRRALPWGSDKRWWTPTLLERFFGRKLRLMPLKRGGFALMLDQVIPTNRGRGFRNPTPRQLRSGKRLGSVPVLWLLPVTRLNKRLDPDSVMSRWAEQAPLLIERAFDGLGEGVGADG